MNKIYRSALGKHIDIEKLRLANEDTIAVGNMKVNARGDELGFGGEVIKGRNEVMRDYYKLATPTVEAQAQATIPTESDIFPQAQKSNLRGNLANSISKQHKILDDQNGDEYASK